MCASGTGAQEVSTIIDQLGEGVSQLLGTGGRDLKSEIGGIMMKQCLNALIEDPKTEIIVLVSKPPAKDVEDQILKIAANAGKPVVVCFIGGDAEKILKKPDYMQQYPWKMQRIRQWHWQRERPYRILKISPWALRKRKRWPQRKEPA
ncbi:MAG: hypothetical protein ACLSE4_12405 [Clostridium sp.]